MLGELGIIATLLQWLHGIRGDRAAIAEKATIDSYLEWLRRHNHDEILSSILESRDTAAKLDQFIRNNVSALLDMGDRILEAVTDAHGDLKSQLEDIKASLANLPTRQEMKEMLADLTKDIQSSYVQKGQGVPSRDILRYRVLGNRLAEFNAQAHAPDVIDKNGLITPQQIQHLHKDMFPDGFAWAGIMRTQPVWIAGFFGTAARAMDLIESRIDIALESPERISEALQRLCNEWNESVSSLSKAKDIDKALALAQFHYRLAVIHPFLDGNGRVARLILDQQASFIFRRPLQLQLDRAEYYKALRLGNAGSMEGLRDIILASIRRCMDSLDAE